MPNDDILDILNNFFVILEDRWNRGIQLFNKQIDDYKEESVRKTLKKRDIINTPIHNIISIEDDYIFLLLDSIFMQRLRGIHHQGLAYLVYPTANHFRFEHSLGVYKLTCDVIKSLKERKDAPIPSKYENLEYSNAELMISALLHDIGHYPFSHIGERCFKTFIDNLPTEERFAEIKRNGIPNHELRTANLILGKDIIGNLKGNDSGRKITNPFEKFFQLITEKPQFQKVARLICPEISDPEPIGTLINGPLDVDKLDYILRESYFTGTPFGNIDLHRIINGYLIRPIPKDGESLENQLTINKRMLPSVLQFYMGKQFNYLTISYHRTVRIAETMLKIIIDIVMNEFLKKFKDRVDFDELLRKIFFHFKLMEDRDFLHFIEIMCSLSPIAKNIYHKLINRTLYKSFINIDSVIVQKSRYDQNINRAMMLQLPTNFLDLRKENPLLQDFWASLNPYLQKNFEELSEIVKEYSEEVFILNTLNYPLSEENLQDELKKKIKNIYIFDKDYSDVAKPFLEDTMGTKLTSFLSEIERFNSTVILATETSLTRILKEKEFLFDQNFIQAFIHYIVVYNRRD
ncbi:hypothetical protein LCGC14_0878960 [marine sediment metagenome]|uniref:HD/PDEase domain-containing protein n=1 Tax=marine sediment metagenome TaxID=412755 RepID=A0A0F9S9G9_9ZZZZ